MSIRSLATSLALAALLVSPAAAQRTQGEILCTAYGTSGWFHDTCQQVSTMDLDVTYSVEGRLATWDRQQNQFEERIRRLPDPDADPAILEQELAKLREAAAEASRGMGEVIDRYARESQRLEAFLRALESISSNEYTPADVVAAAEAFPADKLRSRIATWDEIRTGLISHVIELESLAMAAEEVREQQASAPVDTSFDGVWTSTYGEHIELTQSGLKVTGTYGLDDGRVDLDVVDEHVLDGFWAETSSRVKCESAVLGSEYWGRLELTFEEDFSAYTGRWSYCDEAPVTGAIGWNGEYVRARE